MITSTTTRHIIMALSITITLLAGVIAWVVRTAPETMPAQYGTPFNLMDDRGQPITEQALIGQPSLVFFGFTHCPEVCPTTLYEMSNWLDALGDDGKPLKGLFFSVDPERDTPEIMREYADAFTDRVTGITGDLDEMQRVMKAWRIVARKVPTEDGSYTMDHTASVLMVDSQGRFRGTISYGEDEASALEKIRGLLKAG